MTGQCLVTVHTKQVFAKRVCESINPQVEASAGRSTKCRCTWFCPPSCRMEPSSRRRHKEEEPQVTHRHTGTEGTSWGQSWRSELGSLLLPEWQLLLSLKGLSARPPATLLFYLKALNFASGRAPHRPKAGEQKTNKKALHISLQG